MDTYNFYLGGLMKVTKLNLPERGKIDHYFIAGDWHTQALSIPTFKILIEHAKLFPESQRKLIINGDFLDCPHLMKRSPDFKKWIEHQFKKQFTI